MRILHIAPYSPIPPVFGGALRVFYILHGLARHHEVTFVAFGEGEDFERLKHYLDGVVREVRIVQPNPLAAHHPCLGLLRALGKSESLFSQRSRGTSMQKTINQLFEKHHFDVAVIEFPHMGRFHFPRETVSVLDEHNVEYTNFRRMSRGVHSPARKLLYLREQHMTHLEEVSVCRKVDAIFATSQHDARILDEDVPEKAKFIVPNGVDMQYFVPCDAEPEPYSMVFTGTMDYVPNQDAMFFFLDHIFPHIKKVLPQARIYIVGKNPPEALKARSSSDVIVTGYVDDVRPYTSRAAVYVVPLRMGSGTRLKILEGLAMKKAIVTTSIGCEGIDVKDGRDVIVANDPVSFAVETATLLLNRGRAASLGSNGYALVKTQYNWDEICSLMNSVLTSLVRQKNSARTSKPHTVVVHDASKKSTAVQVAHGVAQPSIKVLMYHRVIDNRPGQSTYSWIVTKSQLREHLTLLKKWGYSFITFEEYALYQQGKRILPKKAIILTFDDGYEGVYMYARPLIAEFGARATAFVLGDRSIRTNFWDTPAGFEGALLMDDEKVLELQASGFEIGSHSMAHPDLTQLNKKRAWEEIVRSKDALEELLKSPVISFAYPFGAANPELEHMVLEAGYLYGCGVFSGPPKFAQDRFNVRRLPVTQGTNAVDLALKILTPYEYYQWGRWEIGQMLHGRESRCHPTTASASIPGIHMSWREKE